jgi:acyl carrier protein
MQVELTVTNLVAKTAERDVEVVRSGRPLQELGIDMLSLVDLVRKLETYFGLAISGKDALKWVGVADVVDFVEERIGYQAAS